MGKKNLTEQFRDWVASADGKAKLIAAAEETYPRKKRWARRMIERRIKAAQTDSAELMVLTIWARNVPADGCPISAKDRLALG